MKKEDIKTYFPFPTYRDNQEDISFKIIEAYEQGYDVVILRAPVGFGKSPVGVAIGKILNSTYYTTPQKMLQDQLAKDFLGNDFAIVKGRNNFDCNNNRNKCDYGECLLKKSKKKRSKDDPSSACDFNADEECPYKLQRDIGRATHICTTNFSYLMSVPEKLFGKRELLIVDESHSIPNWALNFAKTTINLYKRIEGEEISIIDSIPEYSTFEEYLTWLGKIILPLLDQKKSVLLESSESESSEGMSIKEKKLENYLDSLIEKILNLIEDYEKVKEKWVWEIKGKGNFRSIEFQPITVGRFMQDLLWRRADKVLLMSGTILAPSVYVEEVGLSTKKYKVISVPSSFHYHYNPVLYYPMGKMSKDFKDDTLPRMVTKIEEIIDKHGSDKGIIHCNSYDIAEYIYHNLTRYRHRVIFQDRNNRQNSLREFINSKDKIFISINMNEGLDLKDDLARYQILVKIPYPFIGDKRVKERLFERDEQDWFNLQAVEDICQAFGRAVRTEDDWATFYILDESFANLWNRYKDFFTPEFISSYKYGILLKEALESKIKFFT